MFATVTIKMPIEQTPLFRSRSASPPAGSSHDGHAVSTTVQEQKICPVTKAKLGSMGEPILVQLTSRKVWVCCAGCPTKLKSEPEKYLASLERIQAEGVLSVPEQAVIDSGDRKIVYVETEPGVFEGRQVVLGPRIGSRFPVLEGLSPGDKVAAAGAFLIDAETRLNQGAQPTAEPAAAGATHRH
jgi:Cu(I)/Ag(I) efflux system membrane fusion protein